MKRNNLYFPKNASVSLEKKKIKKKEYPLSHGTVSFVINGTWSRICSDALSPHSGKQIFAPFMFQVGGWGIQGAQERGKESCLPPERKRSTPQGSFEKITYNWFYPS